MKAPIRLCLCAALVAGVLAGTLALRPQCCDGTGLDFWNLPALMVTLDQEQRREAELKEIDKVILARIEAKNQVVRDLIDGRLTLRQAMTRFRQIQQPQWRELPKPPGADYAGLTAEEEQLAQQVLGWCDAELRGAEPERFDQTMDRLRAELRAMHE